jgi:hypothetical protein
MDTPPLFEDAAEYPKILSLPPERMLDCVNGKPLQFLPLDSPIATLWWKKEQATSDRLLEHAKMGQLSEDKNHVMHGEWNEFIHGENAIDLNLYSKTYEYI